MFFSACRHWFRSTTASSSGKYIRRCRVCAHSTGCTSKTCPATVSDIYISSKCDYFYLHLRIFVWSTVRHFPLLLLCLGAVVHTINEQWHTKMASLSYCYYFQTIYLFSLLVSKLADPRVLEWYKLIAPPAPTLMLPVINTPVREFFSTSLTCGLFLNFFCFWLIIEYLFIIIGCNEVTRGADRKTRTRRRDAKESQRNEETKILTVGVRALFFCIQTKMLLFYVNVLRYYSRLKQHKPLPLILSE